MTSDKNPLCKLIKRNKLENNKTPLIYELIELVCDKIDITEKDLMNDTFYEPAKTTFTYKVLFEDFFISLPIYGRIIKKLGLMWEEWEKNGFHAVEVKTWNKLKKRQLKVAEEIWNSVEKSLGKTRCFEQLIDEASKKYQEISQIRENVKLCLDNYCQDTCNKDTYNQHLNSMQKQLDRDRIRSIKVHQDIEILIPIANRLNPIYESNVWRTFLQQHKSKVRGKLSLLTF